MSKLEAVRAKVIEAVPEIGRRTGVLTFSNDDGTVGAYPLEPLTLADVLRAIYEVNDEGSEDWVISASGVFLRQDLEDDSFFVGEEWNLALPLDEQELEVIEFLAKVLGV